MEILITFFRFIGILLLVLLMFNLMILVHEWGHFLAGRWRGLYIDRFQIWFGKPIWKKKYNGVQYGLGSIPAGGFVSLPQMAPMESIEGAVKDEDGQPKELPAIKPIDKIIVAFAGPLFSFLLACVFAVVVWAVKKPVSEFVGTTVVGHVVTDSPADKAGIKSGDRITQVDGQIVERFQGMDDSIVWAIIASTNQNIEIEFERPGEGMKTVIVERPEQAPAAAETGPWYQTLWTRVSSRPALRTIGIGPKISPVVARTRVNSPAADAGLRTGDVVLAIDDFRITSPTDLVDYQWEAGRSYTLTYRRGTTEHSTPIVPRIPEKDGVKPMLGIEWDSDGIRKLVRDNPVTQVVNSCKSIGKTLGAVFSPQSDVKAGHLSGPFGIMGTYYDLFRHEDGWRLALWFSVLLNVNLAILNLLPFPVLDGGHIVMAILEGIRKRPLPMRLLEVVQTAFVLMLLGFMVYVTLKDVGDRVPKGRQARPDVPNPQFLPLTKDPV